MHSSAQSCSSRIARLSRLHERQYMSLSECLQSFAVALSTCAASAASSCSMQCIAKRAKRQSGNRGSVRATRRHASNMVTNGAVPRERGLSEPESRGSLSISAACSTSFPPVNSPHIAVSARTSSSGSPRFPSNPRAATAPQFSNPPAPKHKHHGWQRLHAGGAGLRLDGGRPQEVV